MRTKFGAAAAAIALVGLTVSIISPASSDTRYHRLTLHVTDKASDGGEIFIDVGEEGDGAGDYIVIENKLYNAAGTEKVGEATGDCLFLAVLGECDLSFKLRGGLIAFEGPINFAQTSRLAVTGVQDGTRQRTERLSPPLANKASISSSSYFCSTRPKPCPDESRDMRFIYSG